MKKEACSPDKTACMWPDRRQSGMLHPSACLLPSNAALFASRLATASRCRECSSSAPSPNKAGISAGATPSATCIGNACLGVCKGNCALPKELNDALANLNRPLDLSILDALFPAIAHILFNSLTPITDDGAPGSAQSPGRPLHCLGLTLFN